MHRLKLTDTLPKNKGNSLYHDLLLFSLSSSERCKITATDSAIPGQCRRESLTVFAFPILVLPCLQASGPSASLSSPGPSPGYVQPMILEEMPLSPRHPLCFYFLVQPLLAIGLLVPRSSFGERD
jgi:hypothetical protein